MKILLLTLFLSLSIYAAPVNVASLATSGNGTQANPWTGWETLTVTDATEYRFQKGWYAYAVSPNWLKPGVAIIGEAGVNLRHTGSGDAFVMDAGAGVGSLWIQNVRVENLTVWGSSQTRHGFYLRGVRNGVFNNLSVKDVAEAGIWTEACVTNILSNFRVTNHEPTMNFGWGIRPQYGIVTTGRSADWSTTWTIINPVIENIASVGIWFKADSYGNTVINGTSEGNLGVGALIEGSYNSFLQTDFEANSGAYDVEAKGQNNSFINITSAKLVRLAAGQRHRVDGGKLHNLYIHSYVDQCVVTGVTLSGALDDQALSTINFGNWHQLSGFIRVSKIGAVLPATQYPNIVAGVLNTNAQSGDFFATFVSSDFMLANPTGAVDGQKVTWKFSTSGPVPFQINYGNKFRGKSGVFPVMSFTLGAGSWWYLTARYNAAQACWDIVDFSY